MLMFMCIYICTYICTLAYTSAYVCVCVYAVYEDQIRGSLEDTRNSESFMKHVNTKVFIGARTGPTASLVVELLPSDRL